MAKFVLRPKNNAYLEGNKEASALAYLERLFRKSIIEN